VEAGIKPGRRDLALVVADAPCAAAGVFTSNRVAAAPILVSKAHLASGRARAIVVNAGCANAATGPAGLEDAKEMARLVAERVGCPAGEVVVASTGVIGVRLPMEKVRAGIASGAQSLAVDGGADAACAILTTDTRPKETEEKFSVSGTSCTVGGMAKGAGMIAPRMATMLAFFTTDVEVEPKLLRRALSEAVKVTFNRITVDGDTSTNDCAVVLAGGHSGAPAIREEGEAFSAFADALTRASSRLAQMLVRDGEGVSRIAEVAVTGARSAEEADCVARVIAESPLVKTALHGGDPNWGRILAAAGRAGVEIDPDRVSIWIGDVHVAEAGTAREYEEKIAAQAMHEDPVRFRVDLGRGDVEVRMLTSDLTHGYVDINAHYRT